MNAGYSSLLSINISFHVCTELFVYMPTAAFHVALDAVFRCCPSMKRVVFSQAEHPRPGPAHPSSAAIFHLFSVCFFIHCGLILYANQDCAFRFGDANTNEKTRCTPVAHSCGFTAVSEWSYKLIGLRYKVHNEICQPPLWDRWQPSLTLAGPRALTWWMKKRNVLYGHTCIFSRSAHLSACEFHTRDINDVLVSCVWNKR